MDAINQNITSALEDFRNARNRATLKELLSHITGESTQLLAYDEVRRMLRSWGSTKLGVRDIPLNAIVGSVGRYTDFTRDFLPKAEVNAERWARVKIATSELAGLPPIDVYQIGEVYFVQDGNHRVSVAPRQLGAQYIQAFVTEVHTRVPLTPDVKPDDLILMAEYAEFLELTNIDKLRPGSDLRVSVPGQYKILSEHIDIHRYYMGLDFKRDIPYPEAVGHWYDTVYSPIVEVIRTQGILHDFPISTETDLYLWIGEHRTRLEEELGWKIQTKFAASDLAEQFSPARSNLFSRLGSKILDVIVPDQLESGPPVGQWRAQAVSSRAAQRLFIDILVPMDGQEGGWYALDQAGIVAKREGSALHGLHVAASDEAVMGKANQAFEAEFNRRIKKEALNGQLALQSGAITKSILDRAAWSDLVVVNLAHPPGSRPLARLSSGLRDLILRCPRPILATPQRASPLDRPLLAYDGSPKAQEALFIATYLAGRWKLPLFVVCVESSESNASQLLADAEDYLAAHEVEAACLLETGPTAEAILKAREFHGCNIIIMGGYGRNAVMEAVLGSTVDQVLRENPQPTLICR